MKLIVEGIPMPHRIFFTIIVVLLLCIAQQHVFAQDGALLNTIITDPSVNIRCKNLLSDREKSIEKKQRLKALISRNKRLQKQAPSEKKSVKHLLRTNLIRLQNELYLTRLHIQNVEEDTIKKGCPGVVLKE